jgi:hypothetical protein
MSDFMAPHRAELATLTNEDELLEVVAELPEMPDEMDPRWDDDDTLSALARLLVCADMIGERGWKRCMVPVFEKAELGDTYDLSQEIRHGPEKAFADDYEAMAELLIPLVVHRRPGTRYWAARELGILRELVALPALITALNDTVTMVAEEAHDSIGMLAQRHEAARQVLIELGEDPEPLWPQRRGEES